MGFAGVCIGPHKAERQHPSHIHQSCKEAPSLPTLTENSLIILAALLPSQLAHQTKGRMDYTADLANRLTQQVPCCGPGWSSSMHEGPRSEGLLTDEQDGDCC